MTKPTEPTLADLIETLKSLPSGHDKAKDACGAIVRAAVPVLRPFEIEVAVHVAASAASNTVFQLAPGSLRYRCLVSLAAMQLLGVLSRVQEGRKVAGHPPQPARLDLLQISEDVFTAAFTIIENTEQESR